MLPRASQAVRTLSNFELFGLHVVALVQHCAGIFQHRFQSLAVDRQILMNNTNYKQEYQVAYVRLGSVVWNVR